MPQPRSQGGTGATPFHSTTSTGFFSLETNNTTSQTVSMMSSASEVSGLEDMAALQESNRAVMERLERNEQPTPSTDYIQSETSHRPRQPGSPLSNTSEHAMTETRQDLLQGQL